MRVEISLQPDGTFLPPTAARPRAVWARLNLDERTLDEHQLDKITAVVEDVLAKLELRGANGHVFVDGYEQTPEIVPG